MNLVTDLAIILIAAGAFTVIARALKQPLILGYIVAGFLVGPHLGLFNIASTEGVEQWSEIGIIFLLFTLGLEFSFKKLLRVGSSALITAVVKCIGMFAVGMVVGGAMNWSTMECVFLGGLLSMSSTTIIIKAYDDLGLKKRPHTTLLFGSLVFEDLIAVLLLVLLSTMAVSNQFAAGDMAVALAKLAFFLVLCFLVGIYVIPSLLKWARRFLNDEILLIISIGLCFLMVALAELAGFSSALGAFIMGSLLAETIEGEHIEHLVGGIKDLFGAIFFVSVGMMVDPAVIGQHWPTIVVLTIVTIVGILFFSTAGALMVGEGIKNSVHVGFSLAQLGEFAFIIASLGCSLGVMRDFIYPVVVTVSVVTTFLTPYMIKAADPVCDWLYQVLPARLIARLDLSDTTQRDSTAAANAWRHMLRNYFLRILLYGVIIIAMLVFSNLYVEKLAVRFLPSMSTWLLHTLLTLSLLFFISPFLYGFMRPARSSRDDITLLLKENKRNKFLLAALSLIRIFLTILFIFLAITVFFPFSVWSLLLLVVAVALFLLMAQLSLRRLSSIEQRFSDNLNARERMAQARRPITTSIQDKLAGYDVHVDHVVVSADFSYIGKTLREMPFRHHSGVNIIEIARGSRHIRIPSGDERIFPADRLVAVGTTAQLEDFKSIFAANTIPQPQEQQDFAVLNGLVTEVSPLAGKTLRETSMRSAGCMVVSILHDGELITNPTADMSISVGDTIWVAGERKSCQWFL